MSMLGKSSNGKGSSEAEGAGGGVGVRVCLLGDGGLLLSAEFLKYLH